MEDMAPLSLMSVTMWAVVSEVVSEVMSADIG
jgi:hypothetical protein